TNFKLNCSSRMSMPPRVLLIVPKAPEPGIGTPEALSTLLESVGFGSPKLGWFKTLKASNRNCRYLRSVKEKFFNLEKSALKIPGPVTTLRPYHTFREAAWRPPANCTNGP